MKELYLTWDTERKVGDNNLIMLVEQDTDKVNILFSTNQEIGIKNITDLIQNKPMSCTGEKCPLKFGNVSRCTNHNCEDRTPPKTNFDKITESVESLASVLKSVSDCELNLCNECPLYKSKCADVKSIIEWLQKECE